MLLRAAQADRQASRARRLTIPVRICGAGEGELRLSFGEQFDQPLPRFIRMTVELQKFLIMADVHLDDPWIFHDLFRPRFGDFRQTCRYATDCGPQIT
jgi:hypothetical protein